MIHPKQIVIYGCILFTLIGISFLSFKVFYCDNLKVGRNSLGGSPVIIPDKISQGYTLLSSFNQYDSNHEQGEIYLVGLYGQVVHSWKTRLQPFYSIPRKNGNLVVGLISPQTVPGLNGAYGLIQEIDFSGKVVWEYQNSYLHHTFDILPNQNITALIFEEVPDEIAKKIKGGMENTEMEGKIWSDAIIEIDQQGKIVWTWHAYEHLNLDEDILTPLDSRLEWTHANSIQYLPKDPISGKEAFLISLREISTVLIIGKDDGKIIWKSPKNLFNYQHDATLLDNNNLLIFDNGTFRSAIQKPRLGSRVVELNPKNNEIVWEFDGGKSGIDKFFFFSPIVGGAQRLQNGNTLITESTKGHIFEVTPDKIVVWDLINPYTAYSSGPFANNFVFKAARYTLSEIEWPKNLGKSSPETIKYCQGFFLELANLIPDIDIAPL